MSEDLSGKTALVVDDGQFVELALRLARDFGKVYYHNPSLIEGFPKVSKSAIGNGFDEIEWVEEIWPVKNEVDLFVFPDIFNSGLQLELEAQGKRVIGSRTGDRLETQRIGFKKVQERLGLLVPKHLVKDGLTALRQHLSTVQDRWIKFSRFRGSFETEHHINYDLSMAWLNDLACELGPVAEDISFLVEEPIRGEIEFGYDGFCFDGEFPPLTMFGPEVKSKSYIGAVTKYENLDERLRSVNEMLGRELASDSYRNFFSTEVRIARDDENFKDGDAILIEPTCRIPSPPFEAELENYANLSEILWHGSTGNIVTPEMDSEFAVVCRILHDAKPKGWRSLQIPDDLRKWVKLYDAFKLNGLYHIAPKEPHAKRIGAVVGLGDTIEAAIDHCRGTLDGLADQPISSEIHSLVEALKEIKEAGSQGIQFTDQPVPKPELVMKDA